MTDPNRRSPGIEWKQRLYEQYVSTGQSARKPKIQLNTKDYPYYQKIIKEIMPGRMDVSIIDLACGYGALIYSLKSAGYKNVVGIDISPEQVKLAHQLGVKEIECNSIQGYLEDKESVFDIVFLMDILEHLTKEELLTTLDQVYMSMNTKGKIIIHVPNGEGLFGMRTRYGDLTHELCFTSRSIEQALKVAGFRDIRTFEDRPVIHGIRSFFRYLLWEVFTLGPRILLIVETGLFKSILSQNMLVTAEKILE